MQYESAQSGFATPLVVATAGLLILILGVVAYFLLSPKPKQELQIKTPEKQSTPSATPSAKKDETAGWKVYSNTKRGFSLKYPSNYKIIVEPGDIGDSVVISAENSDFDPVNVVPKDLEKGQHIIISVQEFPGNKTLDDIVRELETDPPLTESPQSTKIGGVDAVRLPYDFEGSLITDYIITVKNNKTYSVVIYTALSDQDKLTQASKNILSTFKFLD